MQLQNVKPAHRPRKSRRVARGGKRGGYSGRGIKGQKSRAGAKIRPAIRDILAKLPKQRGRAKNSFKSLYDKPFILNLSDIEKAFKEGGVVSPATLLEKKLIFKWGGKFPVVKILGNGDVSKKLYFQKVLLSASARAKIEKAGGGVK